jgi:hypothetical protein
MAPEAPFSCANRQSLWLLGAEVVVLGAEQWALEDSLSREMNRLESGNVLPAVSILIPKLVR